MVLFVPAEQTCSICSLGQIWLHDLLHETTANSSLLWGVGWGCATKLSLSRGWRESMSSMSSYGLPNIHSFTKNPPKPLRNGPCSSSTTAGEKRTCPSEHGHQGLQSQSQVSSGVLSSVTSSLGYLQCHQEALQEPFCPHTNLAA